MRVISDGVVVWRWCTVVGEIFILAGKGSVTLVARGTGSTRDSRENSRKNRFANSTMAKDLRRLFKRVNGVSSSRGKSNKIIRVRTEEVVRVLTSLIR
jgi:hypothetical protein